MKQVVIAVGALWIVWAVTVALGVPCDPFLLVVLVAGLSWGNEWAGLMLVGLAGWWSEAVIVAPLGSVLGPLLLIYALLRWAFHHFTITTRTAQLPWIMVATIFGVGAKAFVVAGTILWIETLLLPVLATCIGWFLVAPLLERLTRDHYETCRTLP